MVRGERTEHQAGRFRKASLRTIARQPLIRTFSLPMAQSGGSTEQMPSEVKTFPAFVVLGLGFAYRCSRRAPPS